MANCKGLMNDEGFRAYHQKRAATDPFSRDVIRTLSRIEQGELYRRSAGRNNAKDVPEEMVKSAPETKGASKAPE